MVLDTVTQAPVHPYQARAARSVHTFRACESSSPAWRRVVFALVDVSYALGWRHPIQGEPPPPLADELVTETLRCVLIGDAPSRT
jgi:hypothetical protein